MADAVGWIDKPGNREKLTRWLMDAQAGDHANAVARWPWYGRLIHWTRRCPGCAHAKKLREDLT
jgi:hypothetical protein